MSKEGDEVDPWWQGGIWVQMQMNWLHLWVYI